MLIYILNVHLYIYISLSLSCTLSLSLALSLSLNLSIFSAVYHVCCSESLALLISLVLWMARTFFMPFDALSKF